MIIKVTDILHSANGKGKYRESKVGEKYENRKNRLYVVDFNILSYCGGLEMFNITEDKHLTGRAIWTTEYEGHEIDGDNIEIYTWNSIYVGKILDK